MMQELEDIKTHLLTKYASTFNTGFANVSKPNQTNVVMDANEQEYAGIQDSKGNYFYIRSLKETDYTAVKRGARVAFYGTTTKCRIVAVCKTCDEGTLAEVLMAAITSQRHTVKSIDTDKTRIFKDETGHDLTTKNITLVAVDFTVTGIAGNKNCELNTCNC